MDSERVQIEQLWGSSAGRVQRFLIRLVGNLDTANDLLSQTFLEAARHWRHYRGKGSRQAWLFGIARNVARQELRRLRREPSEPLPPDSLAAPPAESGLPAEDIRRMWEAISQLPAHLRQTLALRLTDEMRYEEIAAALDIPVGTVRSRLHQAVRRLRQALKDRQEE